MDKDGFLHNAKTGTKMRRMAAPPKKRKAGNENAPQPKRQKTTERELSETPDSIAVSAQPTPQKTRVNAVRMIILPPERKPKTYSRKAKASKTYNDDVTTDHTSTSQQRKTVKIKSQSIRPAPQMDVPTTQASHKPTPPRNRGNTTKIILNALSDSSAESSDEPRLPQVARTHTTNEASQVAQDGGTERIKETTGEAFQSSSTNATPLPFAEERDNGTLQARQQFYQKQIPKAAKPKTKDIIPREPRTRAARTKAQQNILGSSSSSSSSIDFVSTRRPKRKAKAPLGGSNPSLPVVQTIEGTEGDNVGTEDLSYRPRTRTRARAVNSNDEEADEADEEMTDAEALSDSFAPTPKRAKPGLRNGRKKEETVLSPKSGQGVTKRKNKAGATRIPPKEGTRSESKFSESSTEELIYAHLATHSVGSFLRSEGEETENEVPYEQLMTAERLKRLRKQRERQERREKEERREKRRAERLEDAKE